MIEKIVLPSDLDISNLSYINKLYIIYEHVEYLDEQATQELINQLKAYAQQELGATP